MKTVMQQLIEELNGNSFQELFSNQNYIKEYLETRIKSIYLDIEKEQMMEVVEFCDAHCDDGHFDKEGAIANIKSTFNL